MPRMARRYSDEDRADALAALAANGGNVTGTARQLGVPRNTLLMWSRGDRHPEALADAIPKKLGLADRLDEVARLLVDAMPAKIAKASLAQLAVAAGIAIEKARLLRGQPTAIDERRDSLAARIAEAQARYDQPIDRAIQAEGDPGSDGRGEPLHPAPADRPAG